MHILMARSRSFDDQKQSAHLENEKVLPLISPSVIQLVMFSRTTEAMLLRHRTG
jgi:hypothetical protein